jgi:tyrosine-protein phosphatase SIW14
MKSGSLAFCVLLAACGTTSADTKRIRPTHWAQPVLGSAVPNWHRVTPELHRCAQPDDDGMRELAAFGIRSVVNLREYHSDADEVEGTGLVLIEQKLDAGDLTYPQLVLALREVLQAPKPCVVHCWHGADRTGAVVAAYRIAVEGWTPTQALDEMVAGGFGHSVLYDNLRLLVGSLDAQRLRADVGLPAR